MFAVDNMQATLLVTDRDMNLVYYNKEAMEFLNIPEEELQHSTLTELISGGYIRNSASLEAHHTKRVSMKYVQGRAAIPILTISKPVLDEDGNIMYVVAFSVNEETAEGISKTMQDAHTLAEERLSYISSSFMRGKDLIAASPSMLSLIDMLNKVSPVESSILLSGESGVGKEVLATYIHNNSPRKDKPFIPINCASIPESLAESEFFGYEPGAFTGADRRGKAGIFELGDGGTIFLDEIAEMPLSIQAKFLRVLETMEVTRLGAEKSRKTNFRLIAATNRDLKHMCEEGRFRTDLYYRLNVIAFHIPPLRERFEDIMPLAMYFLNMYNHKYDLNKSLSVEAVRYFQSYTWPGNVRELRNSIERLVITTSGNTITPDSSFVWAEMNQGLTGLMPPVSRPAPQAAPIMPAPALPVPQVPPELTTLKEIMAFYEKKTILDALEKNHGNVTRTADMLQIHRTGLYRKLRAYKEEESSL